MDRIKDSGSFGRGSNPLGGTGQRHSTSERLFFVISVRGYNGSAGYRGVWFIIGLSRYNVNQTRRGQKG